MSIFFKNVSGGNLLINGLTLVNPATVNAGDGTHVDGATIDYQLTWRPLDIRTHQKIRDLINSGGLVLVIDSVQKTQAETIALFDEPDLSIVQNPKIDAYLQTRDQSIVTALTTGDGTAINPLNLTVKPSVAGKKLVIEYNIFVDSNDASAMGFLVSRNGVLLPDSSNGTNDRWAISGIMSRDDEIIDTPQNLSIRIIDKSCLDVDSTYRLVVRATGGTSKTCYLNRSVNSTGADLIEAGLSTVTIREL